MAPPTGYRAGLTFDEYMIDPLTKRQWQILNLTAWYTNKEIASKLGIMPNTIKNMTDTIFVKMRMHDRTGAVVRALLLGIISYESIMKSCGEQCRRMLTCNNQDT